MKILATLPKGMLNKSVHEMMEAALIEGRRKIGDSFVLDMDVAPFWEIEHLSYDIIHIHWPEALFDWNPVTMEDIIGLQDHLKKIRKKGIKIVITRHNSIPHRRHELDNILYQYCYEQADAIFHMEEYSKIEYQKYYGDFDWYARQQHFFAPIIMYTQLPNTITKAEARRQLGIDANRFVYMVLGAIRTKEERSLLERIASELTDKQDMLYVAQWPYYGKRLGLKQWREWRMKKKYPQHYFVPAKPIADEDMQVYLNASDVLICPRTDSLNSGLISLGFSFGLTVLGPSTGNIQPILHKSGNPIYNPQDLSTIGENLAATKKLSKVGKGGENLIFAKKEWSWQRVGELHLNAYQKIIKKYE